MINISVLAWEQVIMKWQRSKYWKRVLLIKLEIISRRNNFKKNNNKAMKCLLMILYYHSYQEKLLTICLLKINHLSRVKLWNNLKIESLIEVILFTRDLKERDTN